MSSFIAKIKGDVSNQWYKLIDGIDDFSYKVDLSDVMEYDPNNRNEDQWFRLSKFNEHPDFDPTLSDMDMADLNTIKSDDFGKLDLLAFFHERKFYLQRISASTYLKKKSIQIIGERVQFKRDSNLLTLMPEPDCIYDMENGNLYFKKLGLAYAIFPGIKNDYREATNEEVKNFIDLSFVKLDGIQIEKIGIANRKRINAIIDKYMAYTDAQKNTLHNYMLTSIGNNLQIVEGKFVIKSDKDLRLILFGLQQRFYKPPLEDEVQVATSTTKLSNL